MIDPEDGKFDISDYLASARGFLPIPIIITEPAVGFGLGAAVAYFHEPRELDREQHPHPVSYTHLTLPTRSCQCRSRWSAVH